MWGGEYIAKQAAKHPSCDCHHSLELPRRANAILTLPGVPDTLAGFGAFHVPSFSLVYRM